MKKQKDYVVLLHGFWRSARSMSKLEKSLGEDGFEVVNIDYPSQKETIESISNSYLKTILQKQCRDKKRKIHFVTHSMGGIIVRHFLAENKLPNLGRVVMLAPPNRGSKMADILSKLGWANDFFGPALRQLITSTKGLPKTIANPDYEVGVIAGKFDGKVSVKATKLETMKDFFGGAIGP